MDYDIQLSHLKKELDKAKTERTRAEAKLESLNKQKEDALLCKASSRENRKDLRDLSEKIAADAHTLLHDEKGVGIELTHGLLQLRDLEF